MDTKTASEEFLSLILKNKGIIIKICNSYCPNKNDRQDLAQEIAYQIWKSGNSFDPGQIFSTWMYRIALNVAISFYRKKSKLGPFVSLSENVMGIEHIDDDSKALEDNMELLQKFISELKELDKALMILYLESKSYAEIAEILGITETNVATRISRAKDTLKQRFVTVQK